MTSQSVATIKYKFLLVLLYKWGGSMKSIAGKLTDCREGQKMISYEVQWICFKESRYLQSFWCILQMKFTQSSYTILYKSLGEDVCI